MTGPPFTVFLVDDDESVLKGLGRLLRVAGYEVRSFASPLVFLAEHDPDIPGCAVLDVSMPGLDGLQLQAALTAGPLVRSVIFLTGAGDIPTSVRAMKAGAVDFLTKPTNPDELIAAIEQAVAKDDAGRRINNDVAAASAGLARLTPREREVLDLVVAGKLNKQIAHDLGTSIKTIKVHRGRMMKRMQVRTVADLVRLDQIARSRHEPATRTDRT